MMNRLNEEFLGSTIDEYTEESHSYDPEENEYIYKNMIEELFNTSDIDEINDEELLDESMKELTVQPKRVSLQDINGRPKPIIKPPMGDKDAILMTLMNEPIQIPLELCATKLILILKDSDEVHNYNGHTKYIEEFNKISNIYLGFYVVKDYNEIIGYVIIKKDAYNLNYIHDIVLEDKDIQQSFLDRNFNSGDVRSILVDHYKCIIQTLAERLSCDYALCYSYEDFPPIETALRILGFNDLGKDSNYGEEGRGIPRVFHKYLKKVSFTTPYSNQINDIYEKKLLNGKLASPLNEDVEVNTYEPIIIRESNHTPTSRGFYTERGLWNPIVMYQNRPCRERVECIIINDNNEVLLWDNSEKNKLPGGGTKFNESLEQQLINECREEVRINITDIEFITDYGVITGRLKPNSIYEGRYSYLYLARYHSKYEGSIPKEDQDDLINKAKWYPYGEAIKIMEKYKDTDRVVYQTLVALAPRFILNEDTDYSYLLDENSIPTSISKETRKKMTDFVVNLMGILDKLGENSKKYREFYDSMTDEQFYKHMKKFLYDESENLYLQVLPNKNEPSLKDIRKSAEFAKVPLNEYIYYRADGDKDDPVRSAYKVPTGPLHVKRLGVKRFLRKIIQRLLGIRMSNQYKAQTV